MTSLCQRQTQPEVCGAELCQLLLFPPRVVMTLGRTNTRTSLCSLHRVDSSRHKPEKAGRRGTLRHCLKCTEVAHSQLLHIFLYCRQVSLQSCLWDDRCSQTRSLIRTASFRLPRVQGSPKFKHTLKDTRRTLCVVLSCRDKKKRFQQTNTTWQNWDTLTSLSEVAVVMLQ